MKKFLSAAVVAMLTAIAATPPAMADDFRVEVSHAGLNLTNPADVAVVEQRIDAAVAAACTDAARITERAACMTTLKTRAMSVLQRRARLAATYTGMSASR
ncbi:UrcA family protein [Alteraurantiacibacter buctensis]|uniref:UrcA family protein n=1 Tax=Alteraurantiacibacter buctensis TaxID=1503981 RepID=A0A844Z495_9SPHN|nr:UrcA family protein [Alteraurantiacibacter buctensis]MXO72663.1 UrcA family protein [Alteraurantiacibacter buctensis]